MNKKAISFSDEKKFKFHTYDPTGRYVTIVICAVNQSEAWNKLGRVCVEHSTVDKVEMVYEQI